MLYVSQDPKSWRPHPDVPEMEEAIQFNVRVADQMAKELEHVQRSGIQVKAECDADTASRLSAGLAKSSSNDALEIPLRDDEEEKKKAEEDKKRAEQQKLEQREKELADKREEKKRKLEQEKASPMAKAKVYNLALRKDIIFA